MRLRAAAAGATLLLLAACSSTLSGHGSTALGSGHPSTPSSPTPSDPTPSNPGPSGAISTNAPVAGSPVPVPGSPAAGAVAALDARLMPAPGGSTPWGDAWGQLENPTITQFVTRDYTPAAVANATTELQAQGLVRVAHRTWIAADNVQGDIVLLQFDAPAGAQSRYLYATSAKAAQTGIRTSALPGAGPHQCYYESSLDADGNVRAIAYSYRGDIAMELFTFSPAHFNSADTAAWMTTEYQRLPG